MSVDFRQVQAAFFAAMQQPAEDRERILNELCAANSDLRAEVELLLKAHESKDGLLDGPVQLSTEDFPISSELVGTRIGVYKLVELLGEGGMGTVYMAEQKKPVRRTVALKVIKQGMDTQRVVARFEAEQQALALMDHPNIARVLDAGATDDGRPYFVMDLVRGIAITDYCDQHRLSRPERLHLFVTVCQAVQHAHQKGVIHRDIKPSNILVELHDVSHVAKMIDFGVAKAISQPLTDRTLVTQFSQMVGTPLYMSPEQVELNGLDVDTRSDIYSLGVLLYELLTGATPFDRESFYRASLDEKRRIIREDDPPRPSHRIGTLDAARISTLAERQRMDVRHLRRDIHRELDWIVMKALEKDRSRRYESAADLAADVKRFLDGDPVRACPPSLSYRLKKYARRYRGQIAAVTAIASMLALGTIVSWGLAVWALREQRAALDHLQTSQSNEQLAQQKHREALEAHAIAREQEHLAKRQRDSAEYDAYVAQILLAGRNWASGHSAFARLDAATPDPGRPDYRSWEWDYLHSQLHRQTYEFSLQASGEAKNTLAWKPDGTCLATVDRTRRVNIWNVATGDRRSSLTGCTGDIHAISWSPDGRFIAAGTDSNVVAVWDVDSGGPPRKLRGQPATVHCVDWHPDSTKVAAGGDDGLVCVWDSRTGERHSTLVCGAGPVLSLDWHPLGRHLLASGENASGRSTQVWDVSTRTRVLETETHPFFGGATFSPDGNRFISDSGGLIHIRDYPKMDIVASFWGPWSRQTAWSHDGQRLATSFPNGAIKIYDVRTVYVGHRPREVVRTMLIPGHKKRVQKLAWSPGGELLASSGVDGTVKVWSTVPSKDTNLARMKNRQLRGIAFSSDGRRLLVGGHDGRARVWDANSRNQIAQTRPTPHSIRSVAWSPDGTRFAVTRDLAVIVCDGETAEQVMPSLELTREPAAVAWSPDGRTLAVGTRGLASRGRVGAVHLFDMASGQLAAKSSESAGECLSVAWNPDASMLVAAGETTRVFDTSLRTVARLTDASRSVAWSPDGESLVTGGLDGTARIYQTEDWAQIRTLSGHAGWVQDVAWHPHVPRLATADMVGAVRIWDSQFGREVALMDLGAGTSKLAHVNSLTWHPDGFSLAAAVWREGLGHIRIWDSQRAQRYWAAHGDLRRRAVHLAEAGEYADALALFSELCDLYPDEANLKATLHSVECLHALELARAGATAKSLKLFRRLSSGPAEETDFRLFLPRELFAASKHDEAIALAEKFVADFPERHEYRYDLANLRESKVKALLEAGQFEEAKPTLRKLAATLPSQPDFRTHLAFHMDTFGRLHETVAMLNSLGDAFRDWPDYRPGLARRLEAVGRTEEAIAIWDELVDDDPEAPTYKLRRASTKATAMVSTSSIGVESFGNGTLSERNYAPWPGLVQVVNRPERVYQSCVNGNESCYYRGDIATLNAAVIKFSEAKVEGHQIVLLPGPGKATTLGGDKIVCNWQLRILGGPASGSTKSQQLVKDEMGILIRNPTICIFAGKELDLSELKIPASVKLLGDEQLVNRYRPANTNNAE